VGPNFAHQRFTLKIDSSGIAYQENSWREIAESRTPRHLLLFSARSARSISATRRTLGAEIDVVAIRILRENLEP
jgi:hypothetical protein